MSIQGKQACARTLHAGKPWNDKVNDAKRKRAQTLADIGKKASAPVKDAKKPTTLDLKSSPCSDLITRTYT